MASKRFTFQLQSVLDVHESATEKARLDLRQAVQKTSRQSEKVQQIRALINGSRQASDNGPNNLVAMIKRDGTYRMQLQRDLAKEERLLNALTRAEDEARKKLTNQRKKEETVRALREAALTEHRVENNRRENNETDELAMLTATRRRKSA